MTTVREKVERALNAAYENGYEGEFSYLSAEDIARDMQHCDADLESVDLNEIIETVRAIRPDVTVSQ